jgi:hypothetical protein
VKKPSRLALFWLDQHDIVTVLALAFLVLALGFGVYFLPLGPAEHVVGTVEAVTIGPSKNAQARLAHVALDSQITLLEVPPNACAVGDTVSLERQRRLWGVAIIAGPMACSVRTRPIGAADTRHVAS